MIKVNNLIGIIPAAGKASRLGKLPFSKELYPIRLENNNTTKNPKVVSKYLLECMALAGITKFHFVLRNGKWDIPAYYGSGSQFGYQICYHLADYEYGVPFTVNQVFPFSKDKIVALGFPDILFNPKNIYNNLLNTLIDKQNITIALGLFPASRPDKYDMVDYDESLNITQIKIKSSNPENLKYAWVNAVWKPEFSVFLNSYVTNRLTTNSEKELINKEYHMGDVIISAIEAGMKVRGVLFKEGNFIDIGTPEDLQKVNLFLTS